MSNLISREEKIELYNKLVASHPEAVRKGDTMPYTSVNGHMYWLPHMFVLQRLTSTY